MLFHSISLIEISQLAMLYSQVNMSVGSNKFINGKLDNSPLYSVCARLKFEKLIESECNIRDGGIAHIQIQIMSRNM